MLSVAGAGRARAAWPRRAPSDSPLWQVIVMEANEHEPQNGHDDEPQSLHDHSATGLAPDAAQRVARFFKKHKKS